MADSDSSSHRFSTVTPDDHGGFIYIAAFLTFTYSNITFLTRCFIKWKVFGSDDWAICLAQVAFEIQFGLLVASVAAGLGKNYELLTKDQYSWVTSLLYGNQVVSCLALGLSKVATLMLVRRLFTRDSKKFWIICNVVFGLMVSWTVVAAVLVSAGCSPASTASRSESQSCPGIFARYEAVVITDVLTDVVLVLMPAYFVCQLHMGISLKLQVITVFAFRLLILPLSILGLTGFEKALHSQNPGVDRAPAIIYQQSQICVSLIAATLPCLKSFIRSFDTGSGMALGDYTDSGGSRGYGRGQSYQMRTLGKDGSPLGSANRDKGDVKVSRRPFAKEHHRNPKAQGTSTSKVTSQTYRSSVARPKEEDAASHGSQELFIRRDVQWEVRSENISPSTGGNDAIAKQTGG